MKPLHLALGAALVSASSVAAIVTRDAPPPQGDVAAQAELSAADLGVNDQGGSDQDENDGPQEDGMDDPMALPPGHPAINGGSVKNLDANGASANAASANAADKAALVWTAPERFESVPNTSSMRLATYAVRDKRGDAELSVVRAGGTAEANAARWIAQFDANARAGAKTTKYTMHGLAVTVVEARGTFDAGGMGGDGAHRDWALVGAIVESAITNAEPSAMSYFFKLTGPATVVTAARTDMDKLITSITSRSPR